MKFILREKAYELSKEQVESKMRNIKPEVARKYFVRVNGVAYPIKQVLSIVTGANRIEFTSMDAASILRRLGFELKNMGFK